MNVAIQSKHGESSLISEIKLDIQVVSSPEDIANQLNEYFTNIGSSLAENSIILATITISLFPGQLVLFILRLLMFLKSISF